eukprot:8258102-Alexandrium_andersonii.AAC.1
MVSRRLLVCLSPWEGHHPPSPDLPLTSTSGMCAGSTWWGDRPGGLPPPGTGARGGARSCWELLQTPPTPLLRSASSARAGGTWKLRSQQMR